MNNYRFENDPAYARSQDANDPLSKFREKFHLPLNNGKNAVYFCGNSLGLEPKETKQLVLQELEDWASLGVAGHVKAKNPWMDYHKMFSNQLASLAGAYPHEVVAMNSLTTNLHLMLSIFYRPGKNRFKIITEAGSFSSDIYALESQVKMHGLDPNVCIIEVGPRTEEFLIREEDILKAIDVHGKELCLVLIGGVNYYTGQAFNMKTIAAAAHKVGAFAGFDLAHAIGNITLNMHLWEADFAVWCSYKYLNSGPGGVGGLFIHEKHANNKKIPRLAGWWGAEEKTKFMMPREFSPAEGAWGFQLSNAPVLSMAAHKAALNIFEEAGIKKVIAKGKKLTSYLEFVLKASESAADDMDEKYQIQVISPLQEEERGAQLSLYVHSKGQELYQTLLSQGFIVDWRAPSVIRVTPAPLYNTFEEVFTFGKLMGKLCTYS